MGYRLVASDMDGTLLNSRCEVSENTKLAIRRAVDKGVIFTLATGRPIQGVANFIPLLSRDAPVITYNGAVIVTGDTNRVLYSQPVLPDSAREILRLSRELGTTAVVWAGGRLFSDKLSELVMEYSDLSCVKPELNIGDDDVISLGVSKILWYDTAERTADFLSMFSSSAPEHITVCTSTPNFLEIFDDRTSKGLALEQVCRIYGIDRSEVIAIGDGFNDLSMLDFAGLGAAMDNAEQEVKAHADFVTRSNEDGGVAYILEKFVL